MRACYWALTDRLIARLKELGVPDPAHEKSK